MSILGCQWFYFRFWYHNIIIQDSGENYISCFILNVWEDTSWCLYDICYYVSRCCFQFLKFMVSPPKKELYAAKEITYIRYKMVFFVSYCSSQVYYHKIHWQISVKWIYLITIVCLFICFHSACLVSNKLLWIYSYSLFFVFLNNFYIFFIKHVCFSIVIRLTNLPNFHRFCNWYIVIVSL